ncbi:BioY protein [Natrialba chahannaoensis JCM 10990]|uniref:BioY protein n=1 Tax=Natrialba chahannaoensis JCM 10990 TaxID=1227492 RepID=M0ACU9_9EURY|nr:biotin transporter BioY [Natrialba chahannaoensis]ELY96560.1 BioY protein [Natrialba chahannaoensis JCM 10990]
METDQQQVDLVDDAIVSQFARAALLTVLLGAAAQIVIPIPGPSPPITLQVLFVFLAGLVLGPVWGSFSMILYLTAGAIGISIFANFGSGIGVLFGETGGYLWSYPLAAALIGLLVHRDYRSHGLRDPATVSLPLVVAALVAGTILIYGMGAAYMAMLLELTAWQAITAAVIPFIPGEIMKMAAAIAIVRSGRLPTSGRQSGR